MYVIIIITQKKQIVVHVCIVDYCNILNMLLKILVV